MTNINTANINFKWDPKSLEIRTLAVERLLEPLVTQVTTLVNSSNKGPSNKKKGRSKKAHVLAASQTGSSRSRLREAEPLGSVCRPSCDLVLSEAERLPAPIGLLAESQQREGRMDHRPRQTPLGRGRAAGEPAPCSSAHRNVTVVVDELSPGGIQREPRPGCRLRRAARWSVPGLIMRPLSGATLPPAPLHPLHPRDSESLSTRLWLSSCL
ncbi:Catenin alpha-1 [Liparis tanakae]|uniref:Catenin alpha-1 n=1 Tax=Liparis tanakae TaxID=230148 RepID=A0A4Z2EJD2_9TELE|nr:Catenin alpha-1 [Liparis tanakae]